MSDHRAFAEYAFCFLPIAHLCAHIGFGDTHYIGWIPIDLYRNALDHKIVDGIVESIKERLLVQFGEAF